MENQVVPLVLLKNNLLKKATSLIYLQKFVDACAKECEKHSDMEHCKKCAEACRNCAEECRAMSHANIA